MQVIYKYPIYGVVVKIQLPQGAQVLTVQTQGDESQMWALVDPAQPAETRHFQVYPTGEPLGEIHEGEERRYIATFQMWDGRFVFHVFELIKKTK